MPQSTLRLLSAAALVLLAVADDVCRDYARYDGKPYTGAEGYTCATYCKTGWCSSQSYVTPKPAAGLAAVYVDGLLDTYLTVEQVERNPKNLTEVPAAWDSGAYYFGKGYHYDYWDSETIADKLNSSDPVWQYVDTAGPPPPKLVEACKKVGTQLGRPTFLVDDGWKFCADFPEHLKHDNRTFIFGVNKSLSPYYWWDTGCKIARDPAGVNNTYWWTCKVSTNNTMLWDANIYGADPTDSLDTNLITWAFNLPWDVACCCCGGGTAANKPGDQLLFQINPEYPDIATKLTPPNFTDLARFLSKDGLYINTTGHLDWADTLYPKAKHTDLRSPLPYTFTNITYPASYPPTLNSDCVDLELDADIENYTLKYKGHNKWADWSGYPCSYYYEDACADGHASQSWNSSGWGPFQFYYNGHIKGGAGVPHAHAGKVSRSLRAHAGNVCCQCGGGKSKLTGQLIRSFDDYDYDLNQVRSTASFTAARPRKRPLSKVVETRASDHLRETLV